jgi:hypothetical protein
MINSEKRMAFLVFIEANVARQIAPFGSFRHSKIFGALFAICPTLS